MPALQAMETQMKAEFWTADGLDIMSGERLIATVWHELDEAQKVAQDITIAVNFRGIYLDLVTVMGELLNHFSQVPNQSEPPPELVARYAELGDRFGAMNAALLPKRGDGE